MISEISAVRCVECEVLCVVCDVVWCGVCGEILS